MTDKKDDEKNEKKETKEETNNENKKEEVKNTIKDENDSGDDSFHEKPILPERNLTNAEIKLQMFQSFFMSFYVRKNLQQLIVCTYI